MASIEFIIHCVSYFIFILSLANANVLYVGEFLTIKEDRMANSLMDCGREGDHLIGE